MKKKYLEELVSVAEAAGTVPPEILLKEAKLVKDGKRPMCLYHMPAIQEKMHSAYCLLDKIAFPPDVYPFVIDRGDGAADYGFASHKWAVDLLEWITGGNVPDYLMHTMLGLLLGYDPKDIADHYDRWGGKRFTYSPSEIPNPLKNSSKPKRFSGLK